jgi:hypothetical protein
MRHPVDRAYRWRRQQREEPETVFPGKGHQGELEEENRRLRRKLKWVQQERDIKRHHQGASVSSIGSRLQTGC